ncbi:MAG TPA: hypothetical protein EYN66_05345 [Myxococcales bacterium]|nr:hypothetical protein [Myxococcales bacterium]
MQRVFLACDGQWEYDQEKSHVSPGSGPKNIRQLTSKQLDALDPDYVRFINPGDYRVARFTCGGGSPANPGSGCHQVAVEI